VTADDGAAMVLAAMGCRVRDLRIGRGWSLRALGDRVHLNAGTLSKIENGADTTIGTAARIACALGVPIGALLPASDCPWCLDFPPRGFTCQRCGTAGPGVTG
jgi:transcriptional regulator with XRE-family HTH domain